MTASLWQAVFGNAHPVEIEIGPGRGEVLLAFAAAHPHTNFFGIERAAALADRIVSAADARRLTNVRAVGGDARCIVQHIVPTASVAAYHVYFPDPWPKTRHRGRRLFHDGTLASQLRRTLVPGGHVHLASDLPSLVETMTRALLAAGLEPLSPPADPPARPTSKYERRYATQGTARAMFRRP